MNLKKGIKILGEKAIISMFKEYKQLDDGPIPGKLVVAPFNPDGLNPLDRKKKIGSCELDQGVTLWKYQRKELHKW